MSTDSINQTWFRIRWTASAPTGLPPVIQADQVIRYGDAEGTWLAALWASRDQDAPRACILRVPAAHAEAVTSYDSWSDAMNDLLFGRTA